MPSVHKILTVYFLLVAAAASAGAQPIPSESPAPNTRTYIRDLDEMPFAVTLTNGAVNVIAQDADGLVWIGTWDGLNRYDGANTKQYNRRAGDSRSLSHQVIRDLDTDGQGRLWVTTDFGVNRLDKADDTFTRYYLDARVGEQYTERSFSLDIAPDGTPYAALYYSGVYRYDDESDTFVKTPASGLGGREPAVRDMFFDRNGALWILEDNNSLLKTAVSENGQSIKILATVALPPEAQSSAVVYDGERHIRFADGGRLCSIDIEAYAPEITCSETIISGNLNAVCLNGEKMILGTSTGCYEVSSRGIERVSGIEASVQAVFKGSQDIIWIGTDGHGLYERYSRPDFATGIRSMQFMQGGAYPVRAILIDNDSSLWIGSKGGGVARLDFCSGEPTPCTHIYNVGNGRTYNSVLSMIADGDRIWIGTDGQGLMYYDSGSAEPRQLPLPRSAAGAGRLQSVYAIVADGSTLYAGTSGGGLFIITLDADKNVRAMENVTHTSPEGFEIGGDIIYSLADDGSRLWIGTRGGGLTVMDKATRRTVTLHSESAGAAPLCSNDVISLLIDGRRRLWVGTTSGLSVAEELPDNPVATAFRTIGRPQGLSNENIHSIRPDIDGNVWVSTSAGLSKIDGNTFTVTSFNRQDGLLNSEYADGAAFVSPDGGALYFGGVKGVDIVYPTRIDMTDFTPNLILSDVTVGSDTRPYDGGSIRVPSGSSSINLRFAVTDFINNNKCHLSYMIEASGLAGLVHDKGRWIDLGDGSRNIALNQLSPGRYRIAVRVSNSSMQWSEPQAYEVVIEWPWWLSGYAIACYVLFLAAVVVLWWHLRRQRQRLQRSIVIEKQEKERKEELHRAKLKFFTNIAHEFSNSITLIYCAAEQLLADGDRRNAVALAGAGADSDSPVTAIKRNAQRMRNQITELMEFRKVETGYVRECPAVVDVPLLVSATTDNFIQEIERRGIRLTVDTASDQDLHSWVVDRTMLEKIVFNLLSNAVKYVPDGGYINLSTGLDESGRSLRLSISNNGHGIPADRMADVFNSFTVLDNFERDLSHGRYSRTGIGLAMCKDLVEMMGGAISLTSEPEAETSFTVTLPRRDASEVRDEAAALAAPAAVELPEGASALAPQGGESAVVTPAAALQTGARRRVLVVDDNREIRRSICAILSDAYRTYEAQDGHEALNVVEETAIDLVICDVIMPGMNGIDFIKAMKTDSHTRHIPIVMLSSKSEMESRIEILDTGADLFVGKPFHPQYLRSAVDNIMRNRSIMREFTASADAYRERYGDSIVSADDKRFVDRAVEALGKKYTDEDYDADALAEDLAISRTQLYRKIKRITGQSPVDFIRSFRLERAAMALKQTDKTIQEILIECGFHNKAYFYRQFAKTYGCSPRDYRLAQQAD